MKFGASYMMPIGQKVEQVHGDDNHLTEWTNLE